MRKSFITLLLIILSLSRCGVGTKDNSVVDDFIPNFTSWVNTTLTAFSMTSANAYVPGSTKKGSGWHELTLNSSPPALEVLDTSVATFILNMYINWAGTCGSYNTYYEARFRLDVSRDGGTTYTSHYSDGYLTVNSGSTARYVWRGLVLEKGQSLVYRLYTAMDEYNRIGSAPNTCMADTIYIGNLDLQIDQLGKTAAIRKPDTYSHKGSDGFTLYSKPVTFTVSNPTVIENGAGPGANQSELTELSLPESLPIVQFNSKAHLRVTYHGNLSWTGCAPDYNNSIAPSFRINFSYSKNSGGITSGGSLAQEAFQNKEANFTYTMRALLNAGDIIQLIPRYQIYYSSATPVNCITSVTFNGTLTIENYPRLD